MLLVSLLLSLVCTSSGCCTARPTWNLYGRPFAGSLTVAHHDPIFAEKYQRPRKTRHVLAQIFSALVPATAFHAHFSLRRNRGNVRSTSRSNARWPDRNTLLHDARSRESSKARAAFTTSINDGSPHVFNLAALVAAEERPAEDPNEVFSEIDVQIAKLVAAARTRLQLGSVLGSINTSSPRTIAKCVSQTLFGTREQGDNDVDPGFFQGNSASYYDPRNSFINDVLQRRLGIPITLSLVYAEVCAQLGYPMVGLNAPMHLMIAPADETLPFVIDPFNGGKILSLSQAAELIAGNTGASVQEGATLLTTLRKRPMLSQMWIARMLRNLQGIYVNANDPVRTLGVAERLRIIGQNHPEVTNKQEQLVCVMQIAQCIFLLGWEERKAEARGLLEQELQDKDLSLDVRHVLETMLSKHQLM